MKTAQILKLALILAILVAIFRLIAGRGRQPWNVQPYSFEPYDEEEDYEDDEDTDEEEDEEDDDEDEEDDDVEGYANAEPAGGGSWSGMPLMNVATDLLPKPSANQMQDFGEFAPKSLLGQNFLDAKKYIGVDTQGSSLRNANYDLRSSPAIPRKDVGPWSQSTIDGDLYRKPLE